MASDPATHARNAAPSGDHARTSARNAVIIVGLIYAAQTLLGLHMHDIVGIIPLDSRDRIVHPTIAIFALMAAAATRRGRIVLHSQP